MKRVWVVEMSLDGAHWDEIASFEDEHEAKQFASAELFSLRRINKGVKIRVRAQME